MDALKYLKEIHRMCKLMKECTDCPFHGCGLTFPWKGNEESAEYKDAEKCISIVEKWTAEHPKKTMSVPENTGSRRWNDVCDNCILRQMRPRDTISEYCAEIFYREKGKRERMEYRKETFMPWV